MADRERGFVYPPLAGNKGRVAEKRIQVHWKSALACRQGPGLGLLSGKGYHKTCFVKHPWSVSAAGNPTSHRD